MKEKFIVEITDHGTVETKTESGTVTGIYRIYNSPEGLLIPLKLLIFMAYMQEDDTEAEIIYPPDQLFS